MDASTQKPKLGGKLLRQQSCSLETSQTQPTFLRKLKRQQSTSLNFQKVLHRIMSGDQTIESSSHDKRTAIREATQNFSAQIRMLQGEMSVIHSMHSSVMDTHRPETKRTDQINKQTESNQIFDSKNQGEISQQQQQAAIAGLVMSGNGSEVQKLKNKEEEQNEITFEYLPKDEIPGFDPRNLHNIKSGKHQTIFINFKLKEFPQETLNSAINAIQFGMKAKICIPSRKLNRTVLLAMSENSQDKLKLIDLQKQTIKRIDITKIRDLEYGIKNEEHQDIKGVDNTRVISFLFTEKEELECLMQFYTSEQRDLFLQGFQYFVKQSHKITIASGSIFKLRNQIKAQLKLEEGKEGRIYDMTEILDILDSKVQLNISRAYMRELYISIIKKTLDQKLAQQKLSYSEYSKIISGQSGLSIPLTTSQFLEIIDKLLDRFELYPMFGKAAKSTTSKFLNFEGFKQFLLFSQKENIDIATISEIFNKIVSEEQRTNLQDQIEIQKELLQESPTNNTRKIPSKIEEAVEQASPLKPSNANEDSISFHGFVRYMYSKNNSIFNPKKLPLYQNMDKPINEYYINCAKNIYHSNFDLLSMTKIAGFNFRHNDRNFPLLYALSRGARYIEIDVWDGEDEPVITYGPIMNSKILISEFAEQLKQQAFIINPYPLFLNIVSYCSFKQTFKMRYLIEKIFGESLYKLPTDYKTHQTLPSPNELKNKIILVGKLPHDYDGLIQEHYTAQDVVKAQQAFAAAQILATQAASHQKQPHSQPLPNRDFVNPGVPNTPFQPQNFIQQQFQQYNNISNSPMRFFNYSTPQNATAAGPQPIYPSNNFSAALSQHNLSGILNLNNSIGQYNSNNITNNFNSQMNINQNYNNNLGNFNNLSGVMLNPNNNKSLSYAAGAISNGLIPVDGTLLTPVHAFSFHNLPGDSLDQEMLELMLQEEMEENTNVVVATGYIDNNNSNLKNQINSNFPNNPKTLKPTQNTHNEQLKSTTEQLDFLTQPSSGNITSAVVSGNALLPQENIQSTQRRSNNSSVKAIDNFFAKNLDRPRFKKYLQIKYEETASSSLTNNELNSNNVNSELFRDVKDEIPQENSSQMNKSRKGVFQTMKHLSGEKVVTYSPRERMLSTQVSNNKLPAKKSNISDTNSELDEVGELQNNKIIQNNNNSEELTSILPITANNNNNNLSAPSQKVTQFKRDSLRLNFSNQSLSQQQIQSQQPSLTNSPAPHIPGLNFHSQNFQVSCIRDYAPVLASNSIESLFCMYISKINNRKPALWEIYELSERDLHQIYQNKLSQSAISSFLTLENFTKKFLTASKPKCKTADSHNPNPVPLFMQGIQFVETFLHTFDRYSLVYQSRFHENGGETCGYVLKPFHLRDHTSKSPARKSKQKIGEAVNTKEQSGQQNEETGFPQQDINENNEQDQDDETTTKHVKISIISGFNLSTVEVDRVDPYVELIVVDGNNHQSFKTFPVENNNMNPLWMYEVQFIVNQPSLTFLIFQAVNAIKGNLLGWFAIPFTCVRQGFRVVPLRDEYLNTLKNSFILCEVTIMDQQILQQ